LDVLDDEVAVTGLALGVDEGSIWISASAVGERLRFSRPCSMSRRFSRSPGRAGMAVASKAGLPSSVDEESGVVRMAAMRPDTSERVSVPVDKSCGAASTRVVT
jgi:hypothetical protein